MSNSTKNRMIGQLILFILCVGIQGITYAQVTPEKIDQRLQKIEQEVYQNPVAIKSELLGYLKQKSAIPDSTLGEIHLYLCITLGMTNQLDSGIWAAQESMRLLPDQSMLKASTLKTMAILYRLKGDWKMAEESIRQSIQLNDSLWKNPFLKTITLQEYASLCLDQSQFFKATTLFLEALKTIQTANQSDPKTVYTAVKLRTNLAEAYGKSKNYPFAIREFRSALAQMDSLKDKDGYVRAGINLAQTYIESKQPQQADSMLQLLMPQAELLQNEELKGYILLYKGDVLAYRKNFSKAISHYRSAFGLLEQNDSRMLPECAIGLLKALKATGGEAEAKEYLKSTILKKTLESATPENQFEFKRAALPFIRKDLNNDALYAYTEELLILEDSVTAQKERESAAQILAQYQFDRQQETEDLLKRENEVLKEKETYKRNQLYFTITIALLSLTVLGMFIVRLLNRSRAKDKKLKAQEQELNYQRERRDWAEKEKDLREQLIQQQKAELVRSMEDAAELRTHLEQLVLEQQEERRKEMLQQFEKTKEEKQGLVYLLSQFNAVYPTFASNLIKAFPKLNRNDVLYCSLVRMNLSTKEISTLLNLEPRSIYIKKQRTIEKMGLDEVTDFDKVVFGI
ncbi:MAG: hypothetical protein ACKORE_06130 [Bacteroidota bacterium]